MDPQPVAILNGRAAYRCNPRLSVRCKKANCFINGGPCSLTLNKAYAMVCRVDYIRGLDDAGLAAYLDRELSDGVPTDWAAWLSEEA